MKYLEVSKVNGLVEIQKEDHEGNFLDYSNEDDYDFICHYLDNSSYEVGYVKVSDEIFIRLHQDYGVRMDSGFKVILYYIV